MTEEEARRRFNAWLAVHPWYVGRIVRVFGDCVMAITAQGELVEVGRLGSIEGRSGQS